jgi:uncharacterized protein with NAD-binding domain and iron-sulfur cluster
MAGLTAAFELSEGRWNERFERITVYQRGWRLGGKGASSRGSNGRIEEHGLHLLLGYYDQTFEMMRRCYEELDRPSTDPSCPIRTWDDAVEPAKRVGVTDLHAGRWLPWIAEFSRMPGAPGPRPSWPRTPLEITGRSLQLLGDFFRSLGPPRQNSGRDRPYLSASPSRMGASSGTRGELDALVRGAAILGLVLPLSLARRFLAAGDVLLDRTDREMLRAFQGARSALKDSVTASPEARRTLHLVEVVTTNVVGMMSDGLLEGADGFRSIDHLDYREWLLSHGIDPAALDSPLLRGMYDLTFAYEDADPSRPRFSAGLGIQLATRMLLGYSGGLFWRMRGGMGEIIFAPLYEVLRRRGVEFRFFHRVDSLHLSPDGCAVDAIDIGIQALPASGPASYDPLARVKGLPCWPSAPLGDQLVPPGVNAAVDLESFHSERRDAGRLTLRSGEDFDAVVFAISVGMVTHICQELVERSEAWRAMSGNLGTVATQSFQLWLRADEHALGWPGEPGDVVSGFTEPFDTWASMSHLLEVEDWPDEDYPSSIAYFCSPLGTSLSSSEETGCETVRRNVQEFLDRDVKALWPAAVGPDGFRWDLLCDGNGSNGLSGQYWRANVDPSDRYVQSLPGTDQFRLPPGNTGFDNLTIAGDWTDCGLNAGCLEAATMSGRLAATATIEHAQRERGRR